MKKILQITIILFLAVNFSGCSKDDEPKEVSLSSKILDKEWIRNFSIRYDSSGMFFAGGSLSGNWEWEDEDALIIKLIYDTSNTIEWHQISNVTDTSIDISLSLSQTYNWSLLGTFTSN